MHDQSATIVSLAELAELKELDAKIKAILPPQYQYNLDAVNPVSMGSAALQMGPDGKVAWDQIWTSFCELALAGGPPHRGTFLQPASAEEVSAAPELYQSVVQEIARGIWSVTELPVLPNLAPGWVGVRCDSAVMASWLVRAIVVENVSARRDDVFLHLPAGPHFRLAKEIKNVVTAMAKTFHYWQYHLFAKPSAEETGPSGERNPFAGALLEPALPEEIRQAPAEHKAVLDAIEQGIARMTGLRASASQCPGWVRVECTNTEMAIWLMRAIIIENVLVRREANFLFLPANPKFLAGDTTPKLVETFARACRLRAAHRIVASTSLHHEVSS